MASTRDYTSLGEFSKNADEVQQPNTPVRVPGDAYRNTEYTTFQQKIGKQFNIVPVSENINQQIFNQTQFTNTLDYQGIPGWSPLVDYIHPAVTFASDGKLYFTKQNNNNVDPVGESNRHEDFWGEFVNAENLYNVYSSQVPGDEGATLVGTTFSTGILGAKRKGWTLQESHDADFNALLPMANMKMLAGMQSQLDASSFVLNQSLNIDNLVITPYSKTTTTPPFNYIGYVTANFIDPIPTPYIYVFNIQKSQFNFGSGGSVIGGKPIIGGYSTSVTNVTSTSISLGAMQITNGTPFFFPNWPASWGNEDPTSRGQWYVTLYCFTFI